MNLKLIRTNKQQDGIFGRLETEGGEQIAVTLEHAYASDNGSYQPKTPVGIYTCKRGEHRLHSMPAPFTTFEVMSVPDHKGILFHVGNFNKDSDGCILLGAKKIINTMSPSMIISSKVAFKSFMDLQKDVDQFTLTITEG